jgi:hypothetical protein
MARDQSLKFLLDTNIISEIRKRDRADARVARWVARTPGDGDRNERHSPSPKYIAASN